MNALALPARMAYAAAAFAVGAALGFYPSVWALGRFTSESSDAYSLFTTALLIGGIMATTLSMLALTLPGIRRKRRSGRSRRVVVAAVVVVIASLVFADQERAIGYDVAFALWLSYVMAFTYVRYGVRDTRRVSASVQSNSSANAD